LRIGDAPTFAGQQLFGDRGLEYVGDPLRRIGVWDRKRGTVLGIAYRNRYGATIRGHLWAPFLPFVDPVTGAATSGPLPAVLLVNGFNSTTLLYRAFAQGLAESGYLVMQFDPQGVGASDKDPNPPSDYCDPYDPGETWKEPQEMGFAEKGSCAGVGNPPPEDLSVILTAKQGEVVDLTEPQFEAGANYAFGALDAVSWLLSSENPWRYLVDETRIGIAGHSIGGFIALMVGNGDPFGRFRAAVSWDTYGRLTSGVMPTVPTLLQQSEQEHLVGPHATPPDPEGLHPTRVTYADLQESCLPAGFVVLRSSTHNEWAYLGPEDLPTGAASRKGERVGLYFTLAWLDRYLKGAATAFVRGDEPAQASSAIERLTATSFDGSADRSSIGTGSFDPTTGQNVPYTIAGEEVSDHLSFLYGSSLALDPCPGP
ncbi:MAG: hypothetical protein ACREQY_04870, partial [Candidatus Binatia bacterium]